MEWLLLLLLGSLAAGTVYWTASSRQPPAEGPKPEGEGPRSSPELPERTPMIPVRAGEVKRLRDLLESVPGPLRPEVVDAGRREAKEAAAEIRRKLRQKKKPLSVSYTTDQLIPRSSPFAHHRRPLQNAEQFVAQQLAEEALNLYERVEKRVANDEIKERIKTNIEDIRRWMEGLDGGEEEALTFPEIIIPLTSQAMALEDLSSGLRKISETLAKDIADALRKEGPLQLRGQAGPPQPRPGEPARPAPLPSKGETEEPPPRMPEVAAGYPPTVAGQRPVAEPAAVAEQAVSAAERAAFAAERAAQAAEMAAVTAERVAPAPPPAPPERISAGRPAKQPILYLVPQKKELPGDVEKGVPGVTVRRGVAPVGPGVPTGPIDYFRHAGEEFQFDEHGRLLTEGWTDEDFKKQWEAYKGLPLVDRRSGIDRRRVEQGGPEERPDRRDGEDRRRRDLFQERDDFLEKWKRHEERKRLLEERGLEPTPETEIIVAPAEVGEGVSVRLAEPLPEPMGLPGADQHPLDQALEEAEHLVDQIHVEAHLGGAPAPEELSPLTLPEAKTEFEERYEPREEGPIGTKIEIVERPLESIRLPEPEPYPEMGVEGPPEEGREERGEPGERPPRRPEAEEAPAPPAEVTAGMGEELGEGVEAAEMPEMPEMPEERGPIQEIRGVLELKPPEEEDAPFLTLTYDFGKIPDSFKLSRDYHTMEFVYYKYKPMLIKAQEFARRKMLKSALNYYRVIKSQNIPPEFRRMINRNIQDITDYLEKFMMSRSGD